MAVTKTHPIKSTLKAAIDYSPYFSQLGKLPFFITSFLGLRGIIESRFRRFWYCSMPLPFLRLKSLVL